MLLGLGAFYTNMSFIRSIGRIMENSGLGEVLKMVYVTNTLEHMVVERLFPEQDQVIALWKLH